MNFIIISEDLAVNKRPRTSYKIEIHFKSFISFIFLYRMLKLSVIWIEKWTTGASIFPFFRSPGYY